MTESNITERANPEEERLYAGPFAAGDEEDILAQVPYAKQQELVASFIMVESELGDHLFQSPQSNSPEERVSFIRDTIENTVEAVNYNLIEATEGRPMVIFWIPKPDGDDVVKEVSVSPKSGSIEDIADAVIEGYRGIMKARPANVKEAFQLLFK